MNYLKYSKLLCLTACVCALTSSNAVAGLLTDLNNWTLIEDPADPNMSASVDNPSQATLSASGGVPLATDIGYKSINGMTADLSTSGCAFDPAADFSLAIDYDFSAGILGLGGISYGFGIGEDDDGMNSAGVAISVSKAAFFNLTAAGGAARINDITQAALPLALFPSSTGSFFVSYEASSGDVTIGIGSAGAAAPSNSDTFENIQQSWNGDKLFPSFFLRSGNADNSPWAAGNADAVFSNFRVLEGTPMSLLIPEPTTITLAMIGCFGIYFRRRR